MFIKVNSGAYQGLESIGIDVEINVSKKGLPKFEIVGLPNKAVDESEERVRNAILNSNIEFPSKRITVNLAPADVPKEGSFYDLPIAIGILATSLGFHIPENSLFFGELSLNGNLRHTKGALLLGLFAKNKGYENIFLPKDSVNEAAIIKGVNVYGVDNLNHLVDFFQNKIKLSPAKYQNNKKEIEKIEFDMAEILGQEQAKRATEIAASGGHNLFMKGSPGSGKTMLARAIPGILPELSDEESLEVTKIYSISGNTSPGDGLIKIRPFRSPHHSISKVGLIGGGSKPKPGEITLSHRGVLFLDEFNEFPRNTLEALRQPLEDGKLTISRIQQQTDYPSQFMLIASSNPCPCGYLSHPKKECSCTEREIRNYQKKISGPILDRIDLHVDVPFVDIEKLKKVNLSKKEKKETQETSTDIKKRVKETREIQIKRFKNEAIKSNAEMKNKEIKKYCTLEETAEDILTQAALRFNLSARSYFKIIKVARTIADLEKSEIIKSNHIAESLQYRPKEKLSSNY